MVDIKKTIFIGVIGIIIVLSITSLMFFLSHKKKETPNPTPMVPIGQETAGESSSGIPSCFEDSRDALGVFTLLRTVRAVQKYSRLFDAYSMVLCQMRDYKTSCSPEVEASLDSKMSTLTSWGADMNDSYAKQIVQAVTTITNLKHGQFLTQVCDICEKQLAIMADDQDIPKDVKLQIIGWNSEFYRSIFDQMNTACK